MPETPSSNHISTKQARVAKLARAMPEQALKTLAHLIDIEWLREAVARTRKDGARGVDRQSAEDYIADLDDNLSTVLDAAKSGRYRAPAVRRVEIPKPGAPGQTRPIGIPTFEDKVLQRAVVMVLEPIFEGDFLDCSFGFRPGRSAHQALARLREVTTSMRGGWILEIDIRKFFDHLDHEHLQRIVRQRVQDGVILRLIGKWLHAGVMTGGTVSYPTAGSPQGGVISPLLANVYLHEVLDTWFARRVAPALAGRCSLVRYADDAVLVFERESDARQVLRALPARFAEYGLTLHPQKTRLLRFTRPPFGGGPTKPESFDFLGFTHYWARSRSGYWVVKRKTARDRLRRSLKAANQWCRVHRHLPLSVQHAMLSRKLRGYFSYFGITGNSRCLQAYRYRVEHIWRKWLCRRSQKAYISFARWSRLRERYALPPARITTNV